MSLVCLVYFIFLFWTWPSNVTGDIDNRNKLYLQLLGNNISVSGTRYDDFVHNTDNNSKAYIPLRRKTTGVGALRWVAPLTQNPNARQWNIGCVGLQTQNSCVGNIHFMLFMSISFAFGSQRKRSFQWNMG